MNHPRTISKTSRPRAKRAGPVLRKLTGAHRLVRHPQDEHRALGLLAEPVHEPRARGLPVPPPGRRSLLLGGESSWQSSQKIATMPLFLGFDVLLIFGLLFHGLNGLRVALVGSGVAADRQKALFWSLMIFGAILLLGAALHIIGSG